MQMIFSTQVFMWRKKLERRNLSKLGWSHKKGHCDNKTNSVKLNICNGQPYMSNHSKLACFLSIKNYFVNFSWPILNRFRGVGQSGLINWSTLACCILRELVNQTQNQLSAATTATTATAAAAAVVTWRLKGGWLASFHAFDETRSPNVKLATILHPNLIP